MQQLINFTEEQERIITAPSHNQFISACPGAGKTKVVVARFIKKAEENQQDACLRGIAILSFTKRAVEEVMHRCRNIDKSHLLNSPNFIGTFDNFINHHFIRPFGTPYHNGAITIYNKWPDVLVEGISLNHLIAKAGGTFDVGGKLEDWQRKALSNPVYKIQWIRKAQSLQENLWNKGYVTCVDARKFALDMLNNDSLGSNLAKALAARYQELIIDEVQDCNLIDLEIINKLRQVGMSILMVGDLNQAIYEFRESDPALIKKYTSSYKQYFLTSNYRSTQTICHIAATLRHNTTPDKACADYAHLNNNILIIAYKKLQLTVGSSFEAFIKSWGFCPKACIVISHRHDTALKACGNVLNPTASITSNLYLLFHNAKHYFHLNNQDHLLSIIKIEQLLLKMLGFKIINSVSSRKFCDGLDLNYRWLRSCAVELLAFLAKLLNEESNIIECVNKCWHFIQALPLPNASLRWKYVRKTLPLPRKTSLSKLEKLLEGSETHTLPLITSNIHQVKGGEYDAVLLVIPEGQKQKTKINKTEALISAWVKNLESEAKRVIYVGVTRARKLLGIAIPHIYLENIKNILEKVGVTPQIVELN